MRTSAPRTAGFTLLEVLVALAIVALGLMAAFGQLNQTATTATRLRDRTLAHWVAQDRLAELRIAREFPAAGDRSGETEFAGVEWKYTVRVAPFKAQFVPPDTIRRVVVEVAFADQPERVVSALTGFVRRPPPVAPQSADAEWTLPDPGDGN